MEIGVSSIEKEATDQVIVYAVMTCVKKVTKKFGTAKLERRKGGWSPVCSDTCAGRGWGSRGWSVALRVGDV